jgi:hypothetical protein
LVSIQLPANWELLWLNYRKTAKVLSDYLYEQGLTFKKTKISFFVDKEDEKLQKIYTLLEEIEQDQLIKD